MAYQLKHLDTEEVVTTSAPPAWMNGMWECGDQRFTDPSRTLYAPVETYAPLTPMAFYLAFMPAERIAIKTSADAVVKEFWETYELAVQTNTPIDPNLASVTGGLAYLRGLGVLASDARIPQILAGTPQ